MSQNLSILIVENSQRSGIDMEAILMPHYDRTWSVESTQEALGFYHDYEPDLFIVDVSVFHRRALELVKQIRQRSPQACIVLVGGVECVELFFEAMELDIDRFIKKPFSATSFLEMINALATRIALERESVHQRKILEEYRKAIDSSNIVSITDKEGVITYANDTFCKISGYSREELLGRRHNIIRHPEMEDAVFRGMWQTITRKKVWRGIVKNRARDGSAYIVDSVVSPIINEYGQIEEYIAIRHDVSALVQQEDIIRRQTTEALTGLKNRIKLIEELERSPCFALCLIDLDGFSDVNDVYGIEFGDEILKLVAKRLVHALPERHYKPYHLGGDEFAIRLQERCDDAMQIFKRVLNEITREPFVHEEQLIYLTARMGIALEEQGDSLNRASIAIKHAKEKRQNFIVYDPSFDLENSYKSNLNWANRLFKALEEGRIVPYFQPILSLKSGKVEKYEALVRMIDEERREVSPYFFLDIAKKTKQYHHITRIMVAQGIQKALESGKEISINLSAQDLENPQTLEFIFSELERAGCGEKIIFEITESEGVNSYEQAKEFIREVKGRFGCKIAIDDFGSGYSNFAHILELEIDYLKIDGSIVKRILEDFRSKALLDSIVNLAHRLGIECVAEFVATKELLENLKESGVDAAQGFYVGKPSAFLL